MTSSSTTFTNKVRGSVVLVLGGSSGVGLGAAAALLESGAHLILSSSRQPKLDAAVASLQSSYPDGSVTGFTCDLASKDIESNLAELFAKVSSHIKDTLKQSQLNHLIYTAGDSLPTMPIEEVTLDKFNQALQVRSAGALLSIKTFLPLLPKTNTTSITLTSGSICEKPIPGGWAVIAFGGAGLTGMTRQLAFDLAPVRVNCVAPGVVNTDLWGAMSAEDKKGLFETMERQLPTGRVPGAHDLAESYLYLCRDRNVTGSVIHSNGGAFLTSR